jgi:hypothetical protein
MPHNAFQILPECQVPANVVSEHPKQLQYLVILNETEYKQMSDILSLMIGENLQQDASNYRKKLYKNYINIIRKIYGLKRIFQNQTLKICCEVIISKKPPVWLYLLVKSLASTR